MARAITAVVPGLAQSETYEGDERDLLQHIATFIARQADRLVKIAQDVPKVDAALL
jgi:serine/threonine-protein kinase HipA